MAAVNQKFHALVMALVQRPCRNTLRAYTWRAHVQAEMRLAFHPVGSGPALHAPSRTANERIFTAWSEGKTPWLQRSSKITLKQHRPKCGSDASGNRRMVMEVLPEKTVREKTVQEEKVQERSVQDKKVQEKFDGGQRLTLQVPMRWSDMDAYGHINNVEVLRILEEARVHAFGPPAGTGLPGVEVPQPIFSDLEADVQALVVEHRVRYLAPLNYRNIAVPVQLWISALKGASFTVAYAIFDPVTENKCVIAETVLAFFREPTGTLVRLSAEKKAQLDLLKGPSNFKA